MTDSFWALLHGKAIEMRYLDLLHPAPEDSRTPEEVINYMLRKLKEAGRDGSV